MPDFGHARLTWVDAQVLRSRQGVIVGAHRLLPGNVVRLVPSVAGGPGISPSARDPRTRAPTGLLAAAPDHLCHVVSTKCARPGCVLVEVVAAPAELREATVGLTAMVQGQHLRLVALSPEPRAAFAPETIVRLAAASASTLLPEGALGRVADRAHAADDPALHTNATMMKKGGWGAYYDVPNSNDLFFHRVYNVSPKDSPGYPVHVHSDLLRFVFVQPLDALSYMLSLPTESQQRFLLAHLSQRDATFMERITAPKFLDSVRQHRHKLQNPVMANLQLRLASLPTTAYA